MVVGIVKSDGKEIKENLNKLLDLLQYKPQKKKVFIKPNIVDALSPRSAVIVDPKIVLALHEILQERGFDEIIVGEGTGFFTKPRHFEVLLKSTKYDKIQKKLGIKILNLQHEERVERDWKYGTLKLPKIIFDEEFEYINLPKMKTHTLTTVTLALKNQKGLLTLGDKRKFHKEHLHDMILELNKIAKPDLVLMDAITALEGSGPTENPQTSIVKMGLLLGAIGENANLEMDNAAITLMGLNIHKIPHVSKIHYETIGESIEAVRKRFKMPKSFVEYGNLIHHMNEKTCTLCQIALSQTLRKINFSTDLRVQFEEARKKYDRIDILQGGGWETLPEGCGKEICLGNCTKEFAEKMNLKYCKGCPPDYHDIVNFMLAEVIGNDT